jgi:hypothetical protein
MILSQLRTGTRRVGRTLTIAMAAVALAACAQMDEDEDSVVGSHLAQPPAGTPPQKPIDAGDIAIVGQEVSQAIMDLPVISSASVPPLVQFAGVTSIIQPPIDTEPYTQLLRDRLLLLTREKLRFVEHTLPPYVPPSKRKKKIAPQPVQNTEDADYQILAELRGHAADDYYRIQVEFVDNRTNEVLFNGLYRIRREADLQPEPAEVPEETPPEPANIPQPPPQQAPLNDLTTPTTTEPAPTGNGAL